MGFLADVMVTVAPQHPELATLLYGRLCHMDFFRQYHLAFYRRHWSGSERNLWKPGDLAIIVEEAVPLPADRDLRDKGAKAI